MRTTLDVDDDVLQAVKELASNRGSTAGKVLSDLARRALGSERVPLVRNGVPLLRRLPASAPRMTMEVVNRLRDEGDPEVDSDGRSHFEDVQPR